MSLGLSRGTRRHFSYGGMPLNDEWIYLGASENVNFEDAKLALRNQMEYLRVRGGDK